MARRLIKNPFTPETECPDCEKLVNLAYRACEAGSNFEDRQIDSQIESFCEQALARYDDSDIEAALSVLKSDEGPAYDSLLTIAEDCAESYVDEKGAHLLVLVPLLAWSRYRIAFGKMPGDLTRNLAELYRQYFATPQCTVVVGDTLISAEHIPERLSLVRRLLQTLVAKGEHGESCDIASLLDSDPPADFSDSRYVVLAVSAPTTSALFPAPQETRIERSRATMQFCLQAHEVLSEFLLGSVFEVQTPAAFFASWRQSEAAMRVYSLKSLVSFVSCMGYTEEEMIATVALFTDPQSEDGEQSQAEIRVGISANRAPNRVLAGVTWPCDLADADGTQDFACDVLTTRGVKSIVAFEQTFPMEWCEECGAPLYANPEGFVTHVENPDADEKEALPPTLN